MEEEEEKPGILTTKQKRFVEEYCASFNARQSAIKAGYSKATAKEMGYENLTKPHIKEAVKKHLDALSMTAEEAIKRLTSWGRGSFRPFVREDSEQGLVVDLAQPSAKQHLHLMRKLKQTKRNYYNPEGEVSHTEYTTEIELHDAKDAVDKIAKIRGLYVDKVMHGMDDSIEDFSVTVHRKK